MPPSGPASASSDGRQTAHSEAVRRVSSRPASAPQAPPSTAPRPGPSAKSAEPFARIAEPDAQAVQQQRRAARARRAPAGEHAAPERTRAAAGFAARRPRARSRSAATPARRGPRRAPPRNPGRRTAAESRSRTEQQRNDRAHRARPRADAPDQRGLHSPMASDRGRRRFVLVVGRRRLGEHERQDLVDATDEVHRRRSCFTSAGTSSRSRWFFAGRSTSRMPGAVRGEDLLLDAAHRQHAAAQRDLAGHRDVGRARSARAGATPPRRTSSRPRVGRVARARRRAGTCRCRSIARSHSGSRLEPLGARAHEGDRRRRRLLHDVAHVAGERISPLPGICVASMKRRSPPAGSRREPVATPGASSRSASSGR